MAKEKTATEVKEPVQMKASEIKAMLDNGQGRKEIADHYGVTLATLKRVINSHPVLKRLRVKPTVPVDLIDDLPEEPAKVKHVAAATTSEAAAPAATADASVASAPTATAEQAPAPQAVAADKGVW